MKKSLLALALFGALSSAAIAQSAVSVYGTVDAGIVSEKGSGNVTKMSSGVQTISHIGFKGTESISRDLKAMFLVEAGLNVDNGTSTDGGLAFGRQSYVGLSSVKMGTVTFGRQFNEVYNTLKTLADPFAIGTAGRADNLIAVGAQVNNAIRYVAPSYAGMTASVMYGAGEVAGDTAAGRTLGASLGYVRGPVELKWAHSSMNDATHTARARVNLLAATYDLVKAKVHLGFADSKDFAGNESRDTLVGISVPYGAGSFMASYVNKNDRSAMSADAEQFGIGYNYNLSKRTNLYTSFARISNKNGAAYTVGNAGEMGSSDRAFNAGVRHSF